MCACCNSRRIKNFVLQELNTARYSRNNSELIQILDSNTMGTHQGLGLYVSVVAYLYLEMPISIYLSTWKSMTVVISY